MTATPEATWRVVPAEPTEEMLAACLESKPENATTEDQRRTATLLRDSARRMRREDYAAMLKAAPVTGREEEIARARDHLSNAINTLGDPCDACDFPGGEAEALRETVQGALLSLKDAADTLDALPPLFAAQPASDDALAKMTVERDRLRDAYIRENDEICQTLGKVLGYPWFKDDQKNFPGATADNGVCVGDHVAPSLAAEAAKALTKVYLEFARTRAALTTALAEMDALREALDRLALAAFDLVSAGPSPKRERAVRDALPLIDEKRS